MKRILPLFSVLVLATAGAWLWALRQGPGLLELPPLAPWPKALAAAPAPPAGTALVGTLRHADGTPAADALIQVTLPTGVRWAWTDGSGNFTLTRIPEERAGLEFIALALEHMPAIFKAETAPGERLQWVLPAPIQELEALPELRCADFEGRVDRGVLPTEGLEVWLVPPPGLDPLAGLVERRATVDANGTYQLPSLTAGIYQAHLLPAWARGGTWPILGTGALSFEPNSSQPTPRLTTLEASITGHIFDASGAPLIGALLIASDPASANHIWPPAQSDATGRFRIDDLPPGTYRLELTSGEAHLERELTLTAGNETSTRFDIPAP